MKKTFIILVSIFLFFIKVNIYASNDSAIEYSNFYVLTGDIDNESGSSYLENENNSGEYIEQKNDTTIEQKNELMKNINNLIIESYKVKFSKIIDNLSDKIKKKSKEERIKILGNVFASVDDKIELISSWKINISKNRKEILVSVFTFIKEQIQDKIKDIVKEK